VAGEYAAELLFFLFKVGESLLEPTLRMYIYDGVCMNHFPDDDICSNLHLLPDKELIVQNSASRYMMYYKLLLNFPAMVMVLFCGAWSDKGGRKLPVMLTCFGTCVSVIVYMLSDSLYTYVTYLPLVLVGAAIRGIFGRSAVMTMAVHSYVADYSEPERRTSKLSSLVATSHFGYLFGSLTAGVCLEKFGFTAVFLTVIIIQTFVVIIACACMRDEGAAGHQSKPTPTFSHDIIACACMRDEGAAGHQSKPTPTSTHDINTSSHVIITSTPISAPPLSSREEEGEEDDPRTPLLSKTVSSCSNQADYMTPILEPITNDQKPAMRENYSSINDISPQLLIHSVGGATDISPQVPIHSVDAATDISPQVPIHSVGGATDIRPQVPIHSVGGATDISPQVPIHSVGAATEVTPQVSIHSVAGATDISPQVQSRSVGVTTDIVLPVGEYTRLMDHALISDEPISTAEQGGGGGGRRKGGGDSIDCSDEALSSKQESCFCKVFDSFSVCMRPRKSIPRCTLFVLFFVIYLQQANKSGETDVLLLFSKRSPLNMSKAGYGYLLAASYASLGFFAFIVPRLMSWVKLNIRDTTLALIGSTFKIASLAVLATSSSQSTLFIASVLCGPHSLTISAAKSMISKICSEKDLGKAFSLLSSGETLSNLLGTILYTNIYSITLPIYPGLVFIVELFLYLIVLLLFCHMAVGFRQRKKRVLLNTSPQSDRSAGYGTMSELLINSRRPESVYISP